MIKDVLLDDFNKIKFSNILLGHDGNKLIYKRKHNKADFTLITSLPGVGKTVLAKLIVAQKHLHGKPIVVFDTFSMDWYLGKYPNSEDYNLPRGLEPFPIKDYHCFNIDNLKKGEKLYKINILKYNEENFKSIGFSDAAASDLGPLIEDYGSSKTLKEFYRFIKSNFYKIRTKKDKSRGIGINLHKFEKVNLLRNLRKMVDQKCWVLDDNKKDSISITDFIQKKQNVCISFDGREDIARIEISRIVEEIIRWLAESKSHRRPILVFEEADSLIPHNPKPEDEYNVNILTSVLLRGRKLGLQCLYLCPKVWNLNDSITDLAHEFVFGKFRGKDYEKIKNIFGYRIAETSRKLYWDRFANYGRGIRNFLYINEQEELQTFVPFNSPIQIHRE